MINFNQNEITFYITFTEPLILKRNATIHLNYVLFSFSIFSVFAISITCGIEGAICDIQLTNPQEKRVLLCQK